jgi:predicted DNA-binding transcriptional regulator AlpA
MKWIPLPGNLERACERLLQAYSPRLGIPGFLTVREIAWALEIKDSTIWKSKYHGNFPMQTANIPSVGMVWKAEDLVEWIKKGGRVQVGCGRPKGKRDKKPRIRRFRRHPQ